MSAIVCGKRSIFFEDLQLSSTNTNSSSSSSPPPVSKRIRCSSSSPVRFSPPTAGGAFSSFSAYLFSSSSPSAIDHLVALFPDMDKQFLERALEGCCNDLDSAIKCLNDLRLSSAENLGYSAGNDAEGTTTQLSNQDSATNNDDTLPAQEPPPMTNLSMNSAEWVELFVREMMSASNIDDAKTRASRALEALEKSICARASAETAQSSHQEENLILKQQLEALIQENNVLKRAVTIQHERQKEFDDRNQELHQLKQLVGQYQEQLRTLEVNNYALTMHLKQAQQNNSMPGRFHPDVF